MVDEDFRAKNIGLRHGTITRKAYEQIAKEAAETNARYEEERFARLKGRVRRPLAGARISDDYGKTWRLFALCDECVKTVEEPRMLKNEGAAGAMKCDWCGALNEK